MEKHGDDMKLMLTIVERGYGKVLTKLYVRHQVKVHFLSQGHGTASSELLDVLGFGGAERTVILSFGAGRAVDRLMYLLDNGTKETAECKGIVADLPLTGMSRIFRALVENKVPEEMEGEVLEKHGKHNLIMIVANHGHTDAIMNTAREAGAGGGTILRSRWVGPEDAQTFYGVTFQAEKEIIVIMASSETRSAIMETVNRKHGLKTEAGAMICSIGVDQTVRLG